MDHSVSLVLHSLMQRTELDVKISLFAKRKYFTASYDQF